MLHHKHNRKAEQLAYALTIWGAILAVLMVIVTLIEVGTKGGAR